MQSKLGAILEASTAVRGFLGVLGFFSLLELEPEWGRLNMV